MVWKLLGRHVLDGHELSDDEALAILHCPDEDLLELLHGACQIRKHYYGNKVKLNMIINTKSGLCPENCGTALNQLFQKLRLKNML